MTNRNRGSGTRKKRERGLAMIGLGAISRFYLAALPSPDWRLCAVCDLDESKLSAWAGRGLFVSTAYDQVLERDDVDAVVINLPNVGHFAACRSALLADKDVCCEKPLTLRLEDAVVLEDLAGRQRRVLFTAFHRRYNRHVRSLADSLQTPPQVARLDYWERIEDHCRADSWYLDPQACGGGCVADNGPNAFDTLRFLLGSLRIESGVIKRNEHGVDIRAEIELRSLRGATAHVSLDWAYDFGERKRVTVVERSGIRHDADMLQSFPGFKQSLFHEYQAVLADFAAAVRDGSYTDAGREIVDLVCQVYRVAEAPVPSPSLTFARP